MMTFSRGQRGDRRVVEMQRLVDEWSGLLRSTLPSSPSGVFTRYPRRAPTVPPAPFSPSIMNTPPVASA